MGVLPLDEVGAGPGLKEGGIREVYTTWEIGIKDGKMDPRFWEEVRRLVSEEAEAAGEQPVSAGECLVVGDELKA